MASRWTAWIGPCVGMLVAGACGDDTEHGDAGVKPPGSPDSAGTMASTGADTGDASSSTGAGASTCPCDRGLFCAAPHVAGVSDPDDERLIYACQAECVPDEQVATWCRSDEPSCCAGSSCDAYGYCVGGSGTGDTSSGSASTGDTSGSTGDTSSSTGDASSSSGGTSSSSGTSSSTG